MTDLLALAVRCEGATGPDRELDALIAAVTRCGSDADWGWALANYPSWVAAADGRVHLEKNGPSFSAPEYTASLDAAMGLVPEGWWLGRLGYVRGPRAHWHATLHRELPEGEDGTVSTGTYGNIPALAIVAASLRARAAQVVSQ